MDHSAEELDQFLSTGGTPEAVAKSTVCGCFRCYQVYPAADVIFADGKSACPSCGWNAVVGNSVAKGCSFDELIDQGYFHFKLDFDEEADHHAEQEEMGRRCEQEELRTREKVD